VGTQTRVVCASIRETRREERVTWPVMRSVEAGQGLAEYALILSLIAIMAIAALVILGREISGVLSTVGAAI